MISQLNFSHFPWQTIRVKILKVIDKCDLTTLNCHYYYLKI